MPPIPSPGAAPVSAFSLLISDLHLAASRPLIVERFFRFLESTVPGAEALYILGDLFEYWVGDDDLDDPFNSSVVRALRTVADRGCRVGLLRGNRDVLLGPGFADACGARLLSEPAIVDLHGVPSLILHGDSLCTDDLAYQAFREQVHSAAWQSRFLAKPLAQRKADIEELRRRSEQEKRHKSAAIMDVNADATAQLLRQFPVTRLIHGHTHRPGFHVHGIDGRRCERWVLADWRDDQAGYLRCDGNGCSAVTI